MLNNWNKPASITTPANGNWDEQKIKLKLKFEDLTDEDLHFEAGKRDEMMNRVQLKLGMTNEELISIISTLK